MPGNRLTARSGSVQRTIDSTDDEVRESKFTTCRRIPFDDARPKELPSIQRQALLDGMNGYVVQAIGN